jgi:hypothetical protein
MKESAGQVDGENPVPFFQRKIQDAGVFDSCGIVYEDVELSEPFVTESSLATSPTNGKMRSLLLDSSLTAGLMSSPTTWAPRAAKSRAVARPMPLAAPVTIATLPSKSRWEFCSFLGTSGFAIIFSSCDALRSVAFYTL